MAVSLELAGAPGDSQESRDALDGDRGGRGGHGGAAAKDAPVPSASRRIEARDGARLLQELARGPERIDPHGEHLTAQEGLTGCLACGHPELYTQRDFPRGVGIAIVVVAALLAPATNYLSLLVAALIDAVLYRFAGRMVVCYVCNARHRGFAETPRHPSFDREIEERLLYGAKAVMGKPMRPGGTADAPEPHH